MKSRPHPDQFDLLNWEPTEPVVAYPPEQVRAATFAAQIAKAVSASLGDSGMSRAEVAKEMSAYLGDDVGENILNAYSSEARADHIINVVRFMGLIHATRDQRLLQLLAEPFGWVVVDAAYLDDIELAETLEAREEINRRVESIRRRKRRRRIVR